MIKGTCHCKSIQFEVYEETLEVRNCYCETCRKLSGADYSVVARIDTAKFKIVEGSELLATYQSKRGKHRYYCKKCFSPIYVAVETEPSFYRVRLGLLDGQPNIKVTGHMWVSEKPAWCKIHDNLPVYSHEYTGN